MQAAVGRSTKSLGWIRLKKLIPKFSFNTGYGYGYGLRRVEIPRRAANPASVAAVVCDVWELSKSEWNKQTAPPFTILRMFD